MGHFYTDFMVVLQGRYPVKSDMVSALTELLHIEKESVYRRLRGDVNFTAEEMMRIAGAWHISLDNIVSPHPDKNRTFHLQTTGFVNPAEEDYAIIPTV